MLIPNKWEKKLSYSACSVSRWCALTWWVQRQVVSKLRKKSVNAHAEAGLLNCTTFRMCCCWGGWARDGEKCGHRGSVAVQNKLSQAVITITCGSPSLIDRSSQGPQMFDPQQQLVICWRRNSLQAHHRERD